MNIFIALIVFIVIFKLFSLKGRISKKKYNEIKDTNPVIIDVRTVNEYNSGHIKGSLNIPHDEILKGIKKLKINKDRVIILYCASGTRSAFALNSLKSEGFNDIYNGGTLSYLRKIVAG